MKNTSQLLTQLKQILTTLKHHAILLTIIIFALLCAYILTLTMQLSTAQPTEASKKEEAKSVARPRVEPTTVDTILGLEEQNVQVQAIFEEARENPFTE
jgi:sensor histidine kinase regulating citrate/malate metabolism